MEENLSELQRDFARTDFATTLLMTDCKKIQYKSMLDDL